MTIATPQRIDLHLHSTASDGVFSPAEVIALAHRHRLDTIALTDHDTLEGYPAALAAADAVGLRLLPGVELSTLQPDGSSVDVLGYLFDIHNQPMQTKLTTILDKRRNRAAHMVEKLNQSGIPLSLERVYAIAGSGAVGRPHVARALYEAGHVATIQLAFDKYIGDNGPAYVPHARLTMQEAITMLHDAGGVAVLAHPCFVPEFETLLPAWVELGLDGIEVYHSAHGPTITMRARVAARQHDLVMTGGSDFHQLVMNNEVIIGSVKVPPECVEQLEARAARYRSPGSA
ncbi:PHP domain-containing protein [Chloroflexota bacterium]